MAILETLPKHLASKSIALTDLGVGGCAWPSGEALEVAANLAKQGAAILGGDVLRLIDDEHVEFTHDSWFLEKAPEWSWDEYVMRSSQWTQDYILSYLERNKEGRFAFSLVVANLEQFAALRDEELNVNNCQRPR